MPANDNMQICNYCGSPFQPEAAFCPYCGQKALTARQAPAPQTAPAQPVSPVRRADYILPGQYDRADQIIKQAYQ